VFDAPLGRLHEQTGKYLDICIHIDAPLEVSLGRRLLRDFKENDKTKEEHLVKVEVHPRQYSPPYRNVHTFFP
jgi:uridine kinase